MDPDLGHLEVSLAAEDLLLEPLQNDLARPPLLLIPEAEIEVEANHFHLAGVKKLDYLLGRAGADPALRRGSNVVEEHLDRGHRIGEVTSRLEAQLLDGGARRRQRSPEHWHQRELLGLAGLAALDERAGSSSVVTLLLRVSPDRDELLHVL